MLSTATPLVWPKLIAFSECRVGQGPARKSEAGYAALQLKVPLLKWTTEHYLAGIETTSLEGWLWARCSSILDTNLGMCPFTTCRMPGPNSR